ncbi:MAG: very short patch repair endonuclease, partial [Alphaproteobacteria bacterium]
SALFKEGFRFRLHTRDLPGKPDIILRKHKTIIFVHGCFWHQHKHCIDGKCPSSNKTYWSKKLERNVLRFKTVRRALKKMGWNVIVVWECHAKHKSFASIGLQKLVKSIKMNPKQK